MFILREKNLYFSRERKSLVIIIREVKQFLLSGQSFCILDDPLVDGLRRLNIILNIISYCDIIRLQYHHIIPPGWGGAWNDHAYSARSNGWSGLPCPCSSWTPLHVDISHLTTMIVLIGIMIMNIIVIILDYAPFCKSSSVWWWPPASSLCRISLLLLSASDQFVITSDLFTFVTGVNKKPFACSFQDR